VQRTLRPSQIPGFRISSCYGPKYLSSALLPLPLPTATKSPHLHQIHAPGAISFRSLFRCAPSIGRAVPTSSYYCMGYRRIPSARSSPHPAAPHKPIAVHSISSFLRVLYTVGVGYQGHHCIFRHFHGSSRSVHPMPPAGCHTAHRSPYNPGRLEYDPGRAELH